MTAQSLSPTLGEIYSVKEEMITHKSHYKKKTGEKMVLKMAEERLIPALSKNDPVSGEVILDDHHLKKYSFINKV